MSLLRFPAASSKNRANSAWPIYICVIVAALLTITGCHIFRENPLDPQSSMAREMTYNGIDALQRGRAQEAQELFAKAAKTAPNDQRIRAELARTLAHNGDTQQAIAEMQQAVRLSGGEAIYHVELGQLYLQTNQWDLARTESELALKSNRRLATAWALRGQVEKAQGQLEQARISLHRALVHDPDMNEVRFQLAQVYFDSQQPQQALSVLDGLLRRCDSNDIPAQYLLLDARALAKLGQLDASVELLAQVADGPQPVPELLLELSRIQTLRGDFANARRTLTRGRELFADRADFQQKLDELPPTGTETAILRYDEVD